MGNNKIVDKLIKDSFPRLKKKKPKILNFKIFNGYASYFPIINLISINKKCNKFSDKEKIGLLVHELCHAEQSNRMGFFKNITEFVAYWFSKKIRKKIEIQADRLAIKKGYAKELLELTKIYEKEFGKMEYGLTQVQIKDYIKKRR